MSRNELNGTFRAVAIPQSNDHGTTMVQWGKSKAGNKQVLLMFHLLDGPQVGRDVPWFGNFTKDSYARTLESLRACGWQGDDLAVVGNQTLDQEVSVVVETKEYEGKVRTRVAWVNKPGAGGIALKDPLSDAELRQFAAQMKGHAKSCPVVEGPKVDRNAMTGNEYDQSAPEDDDRPPLDDEDSIIPF